MSRKSLEQRQSKSNRVMGYIVKKLKREIKKNPDIINQEKMPKSLRKSIIDHIEKTDRFGMGTIGQARTYGHTYGDKAFNQLKGEE